MVKRNWEHTPLFFYNALREAIQNTGLTLAESPETYEGKLPYAWIDQIHYERKQTAVRSTRQGDSYDYIAVVHVFFPWDRQGDLYSAIDKLDGEIQQTIRTNLTYQLLREQDGTLHAILNIN